MELQFKYYIGTRVIFEKNCVQLHKAELGKYGGKAFLVTGRRSAKESGAIDDISDVLEEQDIEYNIFDRVENNPTIENVAEGGREARNNKADFIIGIGGGSPLDASKAIAVLASNDIDPVALYGNTFESKPLPVIAVPTTAGTGSEVTPYAVLTRNDLQTKMSFGNEYTFPVLAFMDAVYTESMPYDVTVNTAVDALSHAVEGYLSRRSTPVSDIFAVEAINIFGLCLNRLITGSIDFETREKLLYMAMLGGMVISHTGTTIIHGMGYNLTFFKGLPHGKANGLLIAEYLNFNYEYSKGKIDKILKTLGMSCIKEFGDLIKSLMGCSLSLKAEEIEKFSFITMQQKSTSYNIRNVNDTDIKDIYRKVFEEKYAE